MDRNAGCPPYARRAIVDHLGRDSRSVARAQAPPDLLDPAPSYNARPALAPK